MSLRLAHPPKSILLIATRQIGDVLLVTPLLRSLRAAWPEAQIDVLVYTNKGGMLEGNPDCNNVIESDEHPDFKGYQILFKTIFRNYDLAVSSQANDRGILYAFLAGKKRIGIVPNLTRQSLWKRMICNAWKLLDNLHTHTVIQNLLLADSLGIQKYFEIIPPADINAIEELDRLLQFDWRNTEYVVLHPFPMWRYKRWTDEGWKALSHYLIATGKFIVLSGGNAKEETTYCEELAAHFPERMQSLAGKTSFGVLSEVLKHATAYIGPDTATTHLAAACGIPTLAIYGPTNPVKWGPWPKNYHSEASPWKMAAPYQRVGNVLLLQGLGECVPCHEEGCDRHKNSESRCLNELPSQRVITALEILMTT